MGESGESQKVPSTSAKREQSEKVIVKVYQQGFTVDDGDLRTYEDPANREFFESITRNEIPAELRKQGKAMVRVNVENHLDEEYVKKKPTIKAFSGSGEFRLSIVDKMNHSYLILGHVLGSPAPEISISSSGGSTTVAESSNSKVNESKALEDLKIDENEPTTMISIRLSDGSRLQTRFNLTHTVQDIRQYIITSRPEYSGQNFVLLTTFPNKELSNSSDTIKQAGLHNAAILQRIK